MSVGGGLWRGGFTPEVQAEWAAAFAPLTLCKPYVQGVQWTHLADGNRISSPIVELLTRRER